MDTITITTMKTIMYVVYTFWVCPHAAAPNVSIACVRNDNNVSPLPVITIRYRIIDPFHAMDNKKKDKIYSTFTKMNLEINEYYSITITRIYYVPNLPSVSACGYQWEGRVLTLTSIKQKNKCKDSHYYNHDFYFLHNNPWNQNEWIIKQDKTRCQSTNASVQTCCL